MPGDCVLVTGGAGYIGSHTLVDLLEHGYTVVVVDNLHNASMESVRVVEKLTGKTVICYKEDLLHVEEMRKIFKKHKFDFIIHFAGLKAVGESMQIPLTYYRNNLGSTMNLIQLMREFNVKNVVFSSSCTVYGNSQYLPIDEKHPTGNCTNPYGRTKYFIEQMFIDIAKGESGWNIILLRYFNPVGAHQSGSLGEDPNGIPNQLMPYVAQVAVGRRPKLMVYGNDYNTPDGTGIRDYIHVVDLANGHVLALDKLKEHCGLKVYNLGTGQGYSVMEMIKAFEKSSGKQIPYEVVGRREGDAEVVYADPTIAHTELGWTAKLGLQDMCDDLWRWQSTNPDGYGIGDVSNGNGVSEIIR